MNLTSVAVSIEHTNGITAAELEKIIHAAVLEAASVRRMHTYTLDTEKDI